MGKTASVVMKMSRHLAGGVCAGALAVAFPAGAQQVDKITPQLGNSVKSLPVIHQLHVDGKGRTVPKMVHRRQQTRRVHSAEPHIDPLLSLQRGTAAPTQRAFSDILQNFDGQSEFLNPPDTVGDIGPGYYIQAINGTGGTSITIYSKSDGSIVSGPFDLDTIATSGDCTDGYGDPVVLYDGLADRWLLSEFSNTGNKLCTYISQTSDPTANWWVYEFPAPEFPDYPKYGVWPDAYYVTTNESSPAVYALERLQMLNGQAASWQRKDTVPSLAGFLFQALTPADIDGPNGPPTGSPGYFMRHRDDEAHNSGSNDPAEDYLELWEMRVDWNTPANTTITKAADLAVAEFDSDLCGYTSFSCFDQPGTSPQLDPLREVIMHRLQYRNFGTYETLVGNFVTDVDGMDHGGIRWFELRRDGAGSWSLHQEGTYAPDAADRWMGSIAMDGCGNIALGYNVVDDTGPVFPGIRYVGRLEEDIPGTMPQGEYSIVEGGDYNGSNRYGDYCSMNLDPSDDRTFWFTCQYNPAGTSHWWRTRIAVFQFEECVEEGTDTNILFLLPRIIRE